MSEETYTQEDMESYGEEIARQIGSNKDNSFSFFTKIIETKDTTRVGNVSDINMGEPQLTLMGLKELELFSRTVEDNQIWADWFQGQSRIITDTSLSREGFLIRASQTQKKELANVTPKERKPNKGWFKKGSRNTQE